MASFWTCLFVKWAMLTFIIAFSNINYNCAGTGVGVREDMPVKGGLQGCIWWDASWCLLSAQLRENRSSVLAHSTLHTQTMAAGGTCHAQHSEQMHLGEIQSRFIIQKLETSYFIYAETCCVPYLHQPKHLGPPTQSSLLRLLKARMCLERWHGFFLYRPTKGKKNQKEPTKYFKMSQPTTVAFHQYLSIVTGDITANRLAQKCHQDHLC